MHASQTEGKTAEDQTFEALGLAKSLADHLEGIVKQMKQLVLLTCKQA